VFGLGDDKIYDGNTTATVSGLRPDSTGAAPTAVWNGASNALFDDPNIGTDRTITYKSSFSDPKHALFATEDMPEGTYQARADILPITPDPDPDITDTDPADTDTDPADSDPAVVDSAETQPDAQRTADLLLLGALATSSKAPDVPVVRAADALPQSLAIAPQAPAPQGPLSLPALPPEPTRVVTPMASPVPLPQRMSPRPVFVPRTLPLLRVPKQDRN
jgi:hypothetical protein